jgi:hypothetical protein
MLEPGHVPTSIVTDSYRAYNAALRYLGLFRTIVAESG